VPVNAPFAALLMQSLLQLLKPLCLGQLRFKACKVSALKRQHKRDYAAGELNNVANLARLHAHVCH
jgi:hypothetical protein